MCRESLRELIDHRPAGMGMPTDAARIRAETRRKEDD
jgi:hypothetical protein